MARLLRKTPIVSLLGFTLLLYSGAVRAETGYITDTLRVGVRPAPDNQTRPVGVVKTGMRFTVLETNNGFVKIITDENLEGWIRDSYVVKTPPAMIRLQKLQQDQDSLKSQFKTMEENSLVLKEANRVLNSRVDQLSAERSQWQLAQAKATLVSNGISWYWWIIGILLVAGAGFYSGVSWYRQTVMKRLGGLRV